MDATITSPSMTVTPAYRSGVSVKFPVSRADSITMRLVQDDGQPVPAGAQVMFEGNAFPVAMNGLVYLSGVADERARERHLAGRPVQRGFHAAHRRRAHS